MAKLKAVIAGSGALGLGFLAERMAVDYELCLVDLPSRVPVLKALAANQGFCVNICRTTGIETRRVKGDFSVAALQGAPAGEEQAEATTAAAPQGRLHDEENGAGKRDAAGNAFVQALTDADLVLTAVGARALPGAMKAIAPVLNRRSRPVWVLFCENGFNIAARHRQELAPHVALADTVMSRMCRFADPEETRYEPLGDGIGQRLVAEAYDFVPLDRDLCEGGPFSAAFQLVGRAEFRMWEDIKLFIHNGLHAFIAYHGLLEGARKFPDVSSALRDEAQRILHEELVPAIAFHHSAAQRDRVEAYGLELLQRLVNPYFNDSIERGVRGTAEKLAPGERLLGGRDFIREAGIEPRGYAATIKAARLVMNKGQTGESWRNQ
jgi:hypothetical protein